MRERWEQIKARAEQLEREVHALFLAYRDPRTPWYARVWLALVVAYALSPIDLIPDFIPILGYLDDLIIVPLGVWVALRLVPPEVMAESRRQAQTIAEEAGPKSRVGAMVVVAIWIIVLAAVAVFLWKRFDR